MGKQWKEWQTIFWGSKITADGDCSHGIKRCLLLGRKAMTNLDSILKSRDITLPTKFGLNQSYGFSSSHVWMWELDHKENWAPKNWCFWTVVLEKTLESPLDCKEIQPVHPNGNQSWLFIGILELKLQYFGHLKRWTESLEKTLMLGKSEGRRRRGQKDEMIVYHHWLNGHEFEQAPGVGYGQGSLVCCRLKEAYMTKQLNWIAGLAQVPVE